MQRVFPLISVLTLILCGCLSLAEKLDDSLVSQINDGSSTVEDVEKLLGKPKFERTGSNGKRVTIYRHRVAYESNDESTAITLNPDDPGSTIYTRAQRQLHVRTLSVLYGLDGRVERHHFYHSRTLIAIDLVNSKLGAVVRPSQLSHIILGGSTRAYLASQFGEPIVEELTSDGNLLLRWLYLEGSSSMDSAPRGQELWIVFSPDGIARDYEVNQNAGVGGKH